MQTQNNSAIVRHKSTNTLFRDLGNDRYKNLSTGLEGAVPADAAQRIFAINLDATALINEFPIIEKLIKGLNLKIIPNDKQ